MVSFNVSIRKNDQVQIISGRDKGKTGKVTEIDPKSGKVTVERANLVKRHLKPTQKNPQGGVVEKELPLHYSKVLLFCPKCNKGVRHGIQIQEAAPKKGKGKAQASASGKVRVCKKCKQSLELAS